MQLHRHSEITYQHYKTLAYHFRLSNHAQWKTYPTTITSKGTFARGISIFKNSVMGWMGLVYYRDKGIKMTSFWLAGNPVLEVLKKLPPRVYSFKGIAVPSVLIDTILGKEKMKLPNTEEKKHTISHSELL